RIRGHGARLTAEEEFIGRKQAEEALRATEERNRLALQAAGTGTWDVDLVRHTHSWSAEAELLFGLAPGTLGADIDLFRRSVHPEDWSALDEEWQAALTERRDFKAIYRT